MRLSNGISATLYDLVELSRKDNFDYVLTRFSSSRQIGDLDVLVKDEDFEKIVKWFTKKGYKKSSHDKALGGRIPGCQVNLEKKGRIKIDLHKDFTWRKDRYLDLRLIWETLSSRTVNKTRVVVPREDVDSFVVLIDIIFEKTYLDEDDFQKIYKAKEVFISKRFASQADKYGWGSTYRRFKAWFNESETHTYPVFLPVGLVLFSYLEKLLKRRKLNIVSCAYYVFFRARYLVNKRLPYR